MNRGMTVRGGVTISSSSRCLLAAEIPRMNRGMTVRGGVTISSSSQCVTLGSSLYYAATWLKLSLLDPSVSYSDDTILFSGSK
ncbi:hypothetical protein [Wolbachia pipientis]